MKMRNLILGGAGFVGSNLTETLLADGQEVLIVDKLIHASSVVFVQELEHKGALFEKLDMRNEKRLLKILQEFKPDNVFHLAANSDIRLQHSEPGRSKDFDDTLLTTLVLAEVAKVCQIKNLWFASSSAIFGERSQPIETLDPKTNLLEPISDYGRAKLASEYILELCYKRNLIESLNILRFPNVVGKRSTHGILFDFMQKYRLNSSEFEVLGDGSQNKPYLHVMDLVNFMAKELNSVKLGVNYLNISPIDTCSVARIVEIFLAETNWNVQPKFGKNPFGWHGDVNSYSFENNLYSSELSTSIDSIRKAISELIIDPRFLGK
jgi:UDP-glucose 4-epimerase